MDKQSAMDKTAFWIIAPILISGLGFLVYKHPELTRKLVKWPLIICLVLLAITTIKMNGRIEAFTQSLDSLYIVRYSPVMEFYNVDSLKTKIHSSDTLIQVLKDRNIENSKRLSLFKGYDDLISLYKNSIQDAIKLRGREFKNLVELEIFASLIFFALYILSYVFEDLWKPKGKKKDNSTNKTTD